MLAEAVRAEQGIEINGRFSFKDMNAIFIGAPHRNVIEFDDDPGNDPASRLTAPGDGLEAYKGHPRVGEGSPYKSIPGKFSPCSFAHALASS